MPLKHHFKPISVHIFSLGCFLKYLGRVARQGTWHCKWKTLGQVSQQRSSPPLRHTAHQSSFVLVSSIPLSPLVASSCCCYRLYVQISQVTNEIKRDQAIYNTLMTVDCCHQTSKAWRMIMIYKSGTGSKRFSAPGQ